MWLAWAILISTTSCAVTSDGCVWTRQFTPDADFEVRWTLNEKRQAVAHNRAWKEFCL
jgi:hypothetical protein